MQNFSKQFFIFMLLALPVSTLESASHKEPVSALVQAQKSHGADQKQDNTIIAAIIKDTTVKQETWFERNSSIVINTAVGVGSFAVGIVVGIGSLLLGFI